MPSDGTPRSRNWWFVQRIDNLPENWESQLIELAIPCCYVVHDMDRKPLDDNDQSGVYVPVAPHVHCILAFSGQLRAQSVLDRLPDSFGVKYVEPVGEKVGACTYLLHRHRTEREREN